MEAILTRKIYDDVQTLGTLIFYKTKKSKYIGSRKIEIFRCNTLELPWKNNEPFVSCIPLGLYTVKLYKSFHHGICFKVTQVSKRTNILIHSGNYYTDTRGCILVGSLKYFDINRDGKLDLIDSKRTLQEILNLKGIKHIFNLEITIE